jgi:hypothetical protein
MSTNDPFQNAVSMTPECPPLIELLKDAAGNGVMSQHVSRCPHCRAELAMALKMDEPADAAAVDFIAKRLSQVNWAAAGRTGVIAKPESLWSRLTRPRILAPAALCFASLLVLVAIVQVNHPPGAAGWQAPREEDIASQHPRSQQVRGIAPLGQVPTVPDLLRWEKVTSAQEYRVRLMEVDHREIWQGRVARESAALPAAAVRRILPGKRMLWDVTAFDDHGKEIANSGSLEFTKNLQ